MRATVAGLLLLAVGSLRAQRDSVRVVHPTISLGLIGQQTTHFGAVWPGITGTAGLDFPVVGPTALRLEGVLAAFAAGVDIDRLCPEGVTCSPLSTPTGLGGGSASFVLRHTGIPFYGAVGVGAWRAWSDGAGTKTGPTFAVGIAPPSTPIALEARYDRPSSPLGLLRSTFAVSLRFAR